MCQDGCSCQKAALIFGLIWVSTTLLTCFLIAYSFNIVEINQVGLKYDNINQDYDKSNIYLNGRHWVGIGSNMKVFNIDYQQMNFNNNSLGYIISKTSDPSEISLEVYIMYRLRPEFLLEIYKTYPDMDYEYSFNSIAKDAILDIAPNFSVQAYMTNRTEISEKFLDSVNRAFRNVYIELVLFELGEIIFYNSYEEAIIENVKSMNDASVQNAQNSLDLSQVNLDNLHSDMNLSINTIISKSKSNTEMLYNKADYEILSAKLTSEGKAYKQFIDGNTLGLKSEELTKFILYNRIDYESYFDENFSKKNMVNSDQRMFENYAFGSNNVVVDKK